MNPTSSIHSHTLVPRNLPRLSRDPVHGLDQVTLAPVTRGFHLSLFSNKLLLAAVMAFGVISPLATTAAYAADTVPAPITQTAGQKFVVLSLQPSNSIKDTKISVSPDHVEAVLKPTSGNGCVVEMEDGTKYSVKESFDDTNKAFSRFVRFTLQPTNDVRDSEMTVNPDHVSGILQPTSGRGSVVELEDGSKYASTQSYADAVKAFPKFLQFALSPANDLKDSQVAVNPDLVAGVLKPTLGTGSVLEMTDGSLYALADSYEAAVQTLN